MGKLINRIYDVNAGQVLVDGVDVRDWGMAALRRQISIIEQDIFLFGRSIADNIAFGKPAARPSRDRPHGPVGPGARLYQRLSRWVSNCRRRTGHDAFRRTTATAGIGARLSHESGDFDFRRFNQQRD